MSERKPLRNSVRFEVFKRDAFTCQYCGRKAPDVVLQCDHIQPVSGGGANDVLNLVTSCVECNSGKSDKTLSETHILNKQRAELELLNERRVQLEMMLEWRSALTEAASKETDLIAERVIDAVGGGLALTDRGRKSLSNWINKFGVELLLDAAEASANSYLQMDENGVVTPESKTRAYDMIPRVALVLKKSKDNPDLRRLYYIRGILRRRLSYLNEAMAMELMRECLLYDIDVDWLEDFSKRCRNWTQFRNSLESFIAEQNDGQN